MVACTSQARTLPGSVAVTRRPPVALRPAASPSGRSGAVEAYPRGTNRVRNGASGDVGAGTWVTVPPGAPHTFANPGDDPAVMLTTFTPDLYVHYSRDIKALLDSGQPMTRETMAPIWKNYATEPSTEFAT
jgi:hypothetical protein